MYNNLRKIREQNGFTQDDMANALGYSSKSTYSMKENGIRKITIEEAHKISKLFKKSIEEIFFDNEVVELTTKLSETG